MWPPLSHCILAVGKVLMSFPHWELLFSPFLWSFDVWLLFPIIVLSWPIFPLLFAFSSIASSKAKHCSDCSLFIYPSTSSSVLFSRCVFCWSYLLELMNCKWMIYGCLHRLICLSFHWGCTRWRAGSPVRNGLGLHSLRVESRPGMLSLRAALARCVIIIMDISPLLSRCLK
jgi:hypothetical protein